MYFNQNLSVASLWISTIVAFGSAIGYTVATENTGKRFLGHTGDEYYKYAVIASLLVIILMFHLHTDGFKRFGMY